MVLIVIGVIITLVILYFVIRLAVRDGVVDAHNAFNSGGSDDEREGHGISKIVCTNCGKKYDMDYPKCPFCKS